jgi:integrase
MPVNPAKNSFTPYIFTNKAMATIFRTCDNLRCYDRRMSTIQFIIPAIIRLLYGTGLRISEAVSLRNRDVDLEKRSIHIRKSKNGEERLVPLSNTLTEVLKQYLYYRDQMPVPNVCDVNGFFFVSPNGTYCRAGTVYAWFRRVLAKSGIPFQGDSKGPRVHDLRHTFAVHSLVKMAKSGMDLYYSLPLLSVFLGHKSLGATEHYVRLTSEMYPNILKDQKGIGTYVFPKSQNLAYDGND